jgi:hypothetical protein
MKLLENSRLGNNLLSKLNERVATLRNVNNMDPNIKLRPE